MTAATHLPRYLLRADLQGFYGLSRGAVDGYQKRGLLPTPDGTCSTGLLWAQRTLEQAREQPIPTLAAAVPIDEDVGWPDVDEANVYMCPNRSGHFIGWTTPSIIGLVQSGRGLLAQWHHVLACARYDGPSIVESSTEDPVELEKLDNGRKRRPDTDHLTVYLLDDPLAIGPIRVSSIAKTAGLQRSRLLARDGNKVGSPYGWLTLPASPSSAKLPEFTLPLLDETYPK